MNITILAFAQSREVFGFSEMTTEIEIGATPREVLEKIAPNSNLDGLRVAVDCEFYDWDQPMQQVREIAIIPPVSGG
ncbi:MoaD/ThiS family protein [Luteolibacter algae]|uniref:MoaD/ThiS family protein n=1 Tax=Luteolibacter algae TaxID=454151 RepID=A0ABW5DBM3_9BACT